MALVVNTSHFQLTHSVEMAPMHIIGLLALWVVVPHTWFELSFARLRTGAVTNCLGAVRLTLMLCYIMVGACYAFLSYWTVHYATLPHQHVGWFCIILSPIWCGACASY